jgi:Ca-activated chloride channel family protein
MSVRFYQPLVLLALLLLPLGVAAWYALERRSSRHAVHFTNLDVLASVAGRSRSWRALVPPLLFALALATAITAAARPRVPRSAPSEQASVVLTIDVSGSMAANDVSPTRLAAAQDAIRRFLHELPSRYRVGIVAFSSAPDVIAPLTRDRTTLSQAIGFLEPGGGTAIGDALERSVQLARSTPIDGGAADQAGGSGQKRPLRAIVMLSDGAQTQGLLAPEQGAERAKSAGIPVYTVALGTPGGTLDLTLGPYERMIPVPPDPQTLRQIARTTGGIAYTAASQHTLRSVYQRLGSKLGRVRTWHEETGVLLGAAAVFAAASLLAATRLVNRIP